LNFLIKNASCYDVVFCLLGFILSGHVVCENDRGYNEHWKRIPFSRCIKRSGGSIFRQESSFRKGSLMCKCVTELFILFILVE